MSADQLTDASSEAAPPADWRALTARFPKLIVVSVTFFGAESRYKNLRGGDLVATHMSGVGYETPWHAPANPQPFHRLKFLGYRETEEYAYPKPGIHLGTPMSISGAALSPNMGSYTRAATGFPAPTSPVITVIWRVSMP